jgi:hypothetical protein
MLVVPRGLMNVRDENVQSPTLPFTGAGAQAPIGT